MIKPLTGPCLILGQRDNATKTSYQSLFGGNASPKYEYTCKKESCPFANVARVQNRGRG